MNRLRKLKLTEEYLRNLQKLHSDEKMQDRRFYLYIGSIILFIICCQAIKLFLK